MVRVQIVAKYFWVVWISYLFILQCHCARDVFKISFSMKYIENILNFTVTLMECLNRIVHFLIRSTISTSREIAGKSLGAILGVDAPADGAHYH